MSKNRRHILSLSGGKDSSALAIYMRDKVPEMEYAFCDTGKELPETYEFIDRLEAFLGKKIARLKRRARFRPLAYDSRWITAIFPGALVHAPAENQTLRRIRRRR